jgi:hypothetical protein
LTPSYVKYLAKPHCVTIKKSEKEVGGLLLMRQNSESGMIEKIVESALLNLITNPIGLRIPISILLYFEKKFTNGF